jgi:hypothetical protein
MGFRRKDTSEKLQVPMLCAKAELRDGHFTYENLSVESCLDSGKPEGAGEKTSMPKQPNHNRW